MISFDPKNPSNKKEKMITDLFNDLSRVVNAHINLNKNSCSPYEIFLMLQAASFAFLGKIMGMCMENICEGKDEFIKECRNIFDLYIKQYENK
jgi:hypothetical protein